MINKSKALALVCGLAAGGFAYWFQPYNESTLWGFSIWLLMALGAFIASFGFVILSRQKPLKTTLFVSLGVIIAIILRIVYDLIFLDTTSHNLAPLEILISCVVTFPSAFIGAHLGAFLQKFINPSK